ncbi:hypothetical protein AALB52_01395 [Lachnospiraceae bacterium 38-14]
MHGRTTQRGNKNREEPGAAEGQQVKTCGAGPIPVRRITGKIKNYTRYKEE